MPRSLPAAPPRQPARPAAGTEALAATSTARAADAPVQAYSGLMQGVCVLAAFTHLCFLGLFLWAGVTFMAAVNVASVLCYGWAYVLARRGRVEQTTFVAAVEVAAHAVLATLAIGWDSGFYQYIVLILPVLVVSNVRPLMLKVGIGMAVAALYLALDWACRGHGAPIGLPHGVLEGLYYFNVVGTMVILIFLAAVYYHLINQAQSALREMASTDPLTRLRNRRAMSEAMRHEHERQRRSDAPLSFILCDLDRFKAINDTFGHDAGDAVLKAASRALADGLRQIDAIARWGGEEFLIMLPDTAAAEAMQVAERLRQRVESQRVALPGAHALHVSVTLGVATVKPQESIEQAIARADAALYRGKHEGRNRVVEAG
jgi:diguanylate cyclase (GGDEF)-like protein